MQLNPLPRAILNGIQDLSTTVPVLAPEQTPQHLPWLFVLAQKGPTTPQLVDAIAAGAIFGSQTWNVLSAYSNHQTLIANRIMGNANSAMICRIQPPNATTAMLRVSVELIPTTIPVYARNSDGTIQYTNPTPQEIAAGGIPTPITSGSPIIGTRMVFWVGTAPYLIGDTALFGKGAIVSNYRQGTVESTDGTATKLGEVTIPDPASPGDTVTVHPTSTLYPLFDIAASSFGDWGNLLGLKLVAPTTRDMVPLDASTADAVSAYLYNLYCVQLNTRTSTATPVLLANGGSSLVGTFKSGVIDPVTTNQLSFADRFVKGWRHDNGAGTPKVDGPFGQFYIYQTMFDTVLTKLTQGYSGTAGTSPVYTFPVQGEGSFDLSASVYGRTASTGFNGSTANNYLFNLFTGVDQNNVPYYSTDVQNSVYFGGVTFENGAVQYASGGSDGLYLDAAGHPMTLTNLSMYEALVQDTMANLDNLPYPIGDMAMYPISAVWDSGFAVPVKKSLLQVIGKRVDTFAFLATQAVAEVDGTVTPVPGQPLPYAYVAQNDADTEQSIATALYAQCLTFPESNVYGTSVCRAAIVGRSGRLVQGDPYSAYRGILPLTHDLADKISKYMGAGNGQWNGKYRFDIKGANLVKIFDMETVNLSYLTQTPLETEYASGVTYAQTYDRYSLFYPAFRTVYSNDTSVLVSLITTLAATQLEKVAFRAWQDITGESDKTDKQLEQDSDADITLATADLFDNRFTIKPVTTVTALDQANGYSWTCAIQIYADNMRTVGSFTIQSFRQSSLNSTAA